MDGNSRIGVLDGVVDAAVREGLEVSNLELNTSAGQYTMSIFDEAHYYCAILADEKKKRDKKEEEKKKKNNNNSNNNNKTSKPCSCAGEVIEMDFALKEKVDKWRPQLLQGLGVVSILLKTLAGCQLTTFHANGVEACSSFGLEKPFSPLAQTSDEMRQAAIHAFSNLSTMSSDSATKNFYLNFLSNSKFEKGFHNVSFFVIY
jgi:hypothetical protein